MTACILDASVAAKWFLPGDDETLVEEAFRLLADYAEGGVRFLVPDLFWLEMANILWKAARTKRITRSCAEESLFALESREIPTAPTLPLISEALAIAATFDRPVYDSVYVALAVSSGLPLLTADERLMNALGAKFPIRWLGSIQ